MNEIRQTANRSLYAETFKDFLFELFPSNDKSSILCKKTRATILQTTSVRHEKLKAFACNLFPPVTIQTEMVKDTALGDIFPQFTVSVTGKRYYFDCQVCKLVCGNSKRFEGVSQMYQHAISMLHKNSVDTAAGRLLVRLKPSTDSNTSIMMRFLGKSPQQSHCEGIWDPTIVQTFQNGA